MPNPLSKSETRRGVLLVCRGKVFVVGEDQSSVIQCDRPAMYRSPVPPYRPGVDDHVRVVLDHHTRACHGAISIGV